MSEKKFFRNCPKCDKQVGHTRANSRDKAVELEQTCRSCSQKGKTLSAEHRAKMGAAHKGKIHSAEAKANISAAKKGKKNYKLAAYKQSVRDAYTEMWGDKYEFPNHYFDKWSIEVKERDAYTCKKCATVAACYKINSHHIVPKEYFMARALDIDNGITLCNGCHQKVHRELDTYVVNGVKFTATDFINHYNGWKPNGKK